MSVAPYDLVMLGVLLAATAVGAWKGLARQVASLAAIFASYFVAYQYREPVAAWIPIGAPWRVFLAMLWLYLGMSLIIWIAFRWVSRWIDRLKLKDFDRQIGALLGLVKGVILCMLITFFAVTLLGERLRTAIVNSHSGFYIALILNRAHRVMPDELHEMLQPYLEVLDERLAGPRKLGMGAGEGHGPEQVAHRVVRGSRPTEHGALAGRGFGLAEPPFGHRSTRRRPVQRAGGQDGGDLANSRAKRGP
ncbi:MAG: CvpA family protein [Pirellulaceae bacterium]